MTIKIVDTRPRDDGYQHPVTCDRCGTTHTDDINIRCIDDNGVCEDCCMADARKLARRKTMHNAKMVANIIRQLVEIRDSDDHAMALETLEALQMHVGDCINKLTSYGDDIPDGDISF